MLCGDNNVKTNMLQLLMGVQLWPELYQDKRMGLVLGHVFGLVLGQLLMGVASYGQDQ
jgi:hypothetical protein